MTVDIDRIDERLVAIGERALEFERRYADDLARVDDRYRDCARNLLHYIAFRELDIRDLDFSSYLGRMRSHYRYKLRSSIRRFQGVETKVLADNRTFDNRLYCLYEQVYERSDVKLEKLPISFFQELPASVSVFSAGNRLLGFIQTLCSEQGGRKEQIFLFGGLEYSLNAQFHTYINMLLHVIRSGTELGADRVNMGQTA